MFKEVDWITDFLSGIRSLGVSPRIISETVFGLNSTVVACVPLGVATQNHEADIVLHEDVYRRRKPLVLARLASQLGLNTLRIHGRKTRVMEIDKAIAENFLNENHLMGFGGGVTFLGLYNSQILVAVAVFAKVRFMKYENPTYYSGELERYCSLVNTTVVGGLDKLIAHYCQSQRVDDLVTTVDLEWSLGRSYLNLGFEEVGRTEGLQFEVSPDTFSRKLLPVNAGSINGSFVVHNRGNLKLRKWINTT